MNIKPKIICWLLGHLKWEPYNGNFLDPYCPRCGKKPGIMEIIRQASKKL